MEHLFVGLLVDVALLLRSAVKRLFSCMNDTILSTIPSIFFLQDIFHENEQANLSS